MHLLLGTQVLPAGGSLVFSQPPSPLLTHALGGPERLDALLTGYEEFEEKLNYRFKDRSVPHAVAASIVVFSIICKKTVCLSL